MNHLQGNSKLLLNLMFKFSFAQSNGESDEPCSPDQKKECNYAPVSKIDVGEDIVPLDQQGHHYISLCNDELCLLKSEAVAPSYLSPNGEDIVSKQYEGGYKLWEGSVDLAGYLYTEHRDDELFNNRTQVLELGAGHGLPGIVATKCGAGFLTLHDYNEDVIREVTGPNVRANVDNDVTVAYYSGDWALLPSVLNRTFDVILSAETTYDTTQISVLSECLLKLLQDNGVAFIAGKSYYFGVGGGIRSLETTLRKEAQRLNVSLQIQRVREIRDGSSNVREILRICKVTDNAP